MQEEAHFNEADCDLFDRDESRGFSIAELKAETTKWQDLQPGHRIPKPYSPTLRPIEAKCGIK
jgi:hypothetical protein